MSYSNARLSSFKKTALASSVILAISVLAIRPAQASSLTISSDQSSTQTWASGDLVVNPNVTVSAATAISALAGETLGSLTNNGSIVGSGSGAAVHIGVSAGQIDTVGAIVNSAGATIVSQGQTGVGIAHASLGTLSNSGLISALRRGVDNESTIGTLVNNSGATIYDSSNRGQDIANNGTITSIQNLGTLSVDSSTSNSDGPAGAALAANPMGIANYGTVDAISNSGTITIAGASATGIFSSGTIGSIVNSGRILVSGVSSAGIDNSGGSLASLSNSGSIIATGAGSNGVFNTGTLTSLTNTGLIAGDRGVYVGGLGIIATLNNDAGTIVGTIGVLDHGTIGSLQNSGTIAGLSYAIDITGVHAIAPEAIVNSNLIAGNIENDSSSTLTINAAPSSFGTLTGSSGGTGIADIGAITNTSADLVFASGEQLLNDNINVGGHTVYLDLLDQTATLRVNNQLAISGNYHQGALGTLEIGVNAGASSNGVNADSGYGRLNVSGVATIVPGATVDLHGQGFTFASGQKFMIVEGGNGSAYGSLINNGASGSGGLTLDLNEISGNGVFVDSNNQLIVTVGAPGDSGAASTRNAIASLAGLSNVSNIAANPSLLPLYNAMEAANAQGTAAANHAGAQFSAAPNAVAGAQASMASTTQVLNIVTSHSGAIRLAQADGASGLSAGERPDDWALWGEGFGGQTSQGERNDVAGYNAHYNGVLIGADSAFGAHWRAGGLLSYGNTSVADTGDNSGSGTHVDSYGLLGYASYTGKPWYLDLTGGVIQQQYDTVRQIDITDFSATASGQHRGMQYVASVEAGYPVKLLADTTLTPIAALNYSYLTQSGYAESAGNGAALVVGAVNDTSVKSDLGARLERAFATEYGDLVPSLQLSWRHEYQNTRLQTSADYAQDASGAGAFTTYGPTPITDSGVLTLGVTLLHGRNLTLSGEYQVNAASGYSAQTADLRVRYLF